MGSSVRASLPTRSSAPTATPLIRKKSVGAWARSVPETGAAIRARSTNQTQKPHERAEPNNPVELTAYSVRSCVAPASGSSSPGALEAMESIVTEAFDDVVQQYID